MNTAARPRRSRRWRRAARRSADGDRERGAERYSEPSGSCAGRRGARGGRGAETTESRELDRRATGDDRGLVSRPSSASAGLRVTTGERRRHPYRPLATRCLANLRRRPCTCRRRAGVATPETRDCAEERESPEGSGTSSSDKLPALFRLSTFKTVYFWRKCFIKGIMKIENRSF